MQTHRGMRTTIGTGKLWVHLMIKPVLHVECMRSTNLTVINFRPLFTKSS